MYWLKRDGRSLGDPSKNPWCGDFVETCIRMALPDEPLLGALGTNPYLGAQLAAVRGQETKPVTGAVLIFERGSGGHVGFAVGQDETHFYVLGGNQSDAVTIARIAKSRLLSARWPATYPPRPQRLPTMKRANSSQPPMKSELENTMLKPAILALIRQILTVAGTALVAKGLVQASDLEPVIGALLTIGSAVCSSPTSGTGKPAGSMPA